MTIFREFSFDSAHYLPNVPEGHKCRNLHGHTYRLKVFVEGEPDDNLGWVMDFAELRQKVNGVVDIVDHKTLNDIEGLQNPTCEVLAGWLWQRIKSEIPLLKKIELKETSVSGVIYCD